MCKKNSYKSKKEAKKVSRKIMSAGSGWSVLNPYKCKICKFWHLTSLNKKESALIKENKRRMEVINGIRKNSNVKYLLKVQEPWMEVTYINNVCYVTFDTYNRCRRIMLNW